MTPDTVFAVPGDLATPTGGYAYARRLLAALPARGVAVRPLALPGSFPAPAPRDVAEALRRLAAAPTGATLLVDGLAFGALPAAGIAALGRRIVALVHHPLAEETGLDPARRTAFAAGERAALAQAHGVVATSRATARALAAEYGVPETRIAVAEPGTDPAPRARGAGGDRVSLLSVGAVSPRKGYGLLVDALAELAALPWRLAIVGALDRAPEEVAALRRRIAAAGLDSGVELTGALDAAALDRRFDAADLFVMASHHEGYGMALAEALARGIPIVTATGGAAGETVPDGAALKVPSGDVGALRAALRAALGDAALRRRLADGAWEAGRRLPRWDDTASCVARALAEAAR